MNPEMLDTLIAALAFSPENHLLRKQVVLGLLEARRWDDLEAQAAPLLRTEHRAVAGFALAHVAEARGDLGQARELYQTAIAADPALIDEEFEARLEPTPALDGDFSLDNFAMAPPRFRGYRGPRITFADVGGMETLKEQIRMNIVYPFQHPEMFRAYGKKVGGGILMYGPPGCGKTHIARATAGEMGASFFPLSLNEVLDMYIGQTEKGLNELFETARASSPAVIFIDEIDALGTKRSEATSTHIRMMVTQLLTEMDGIDSQNASLLVLGATNEPWSIDPAFRRPGRFDRVLFVPPPDAQARAEIMQLHARGRKIEAGIAWASVAQTAEHFSGADLAALVDRACEFALTDAMRTGNMRPVTPQYFARALRDQRPSTMEWLRRAKNYVQYANQDGFYDTLAQFLEEKKLK